MRKKKRCDIKIEEYLIVVSKEKWGEKRKKEIGVISWKMIKAYASV